MRQLDEQGNPVPHNRIEAELWACQKGMDAHEYGSPAWERYHDIQQALTWFMDPVSCAPPTTLVERDKPHPYARSVSLERPQGLPA
jgi:hypothetical protein